MSEDRAKVVEIKTEEVDPISAWLARAQSRATKIARGIESGAKVVRAIGKVLEEASDAMRRK